MDRTRLPQIKTGHRHPDWFALYESAPAEKLPWHSAILDLDIRSFLESSARKGDRLLDIGCGLGHQSAAMAEMGFQLIATDISDAATRRARGLFPDVTFITDDILASTLSEKFDIIVDRGCFHVLDREQAKAYVGVIARLLKANGFFLLKVFSAEEPESDFGPVRYSLPALQEIFAGSLDLLNAGQTVFQGSTPCSPKALFCVFKQQSAKVEIMNIRT